MADLINICHFIVVHLNRVYEGDQNIGSCENLVRYNFQNLLTIVAEFLQKCHSKTVLHLSH